MKEYFDVVDENDKVIARASRDECHSKGLWHRGIHIIILNSEGKVLLQKRTMKKDLYKGYWTDAVSGHVESGQGYEEAAYRELEEELGIRTELRKLFDVRKETGNDNELLRFFVGKHNGPFRFDKDEIEKVEFFPLEKVFRMLETEKFTPATLDAFRKIRQKPSILKKLGLS